MRSLLLPPFVLALTATLFLHFFLPNLHLCTFAPFLAILYTNTHFSKALLLSFCCGTLLDLLSSYSHLGIYGLNFVLTTCLLYGQKKQFFEEKPLALSLFTFFIALISTLLHPFLLHIFEESLPLSWNLFLIDGLFFSTIDALYAFLWFTYPLQLYNGTKDKNKNELS